MARKLTKNEFSKDFKTGFSYPWGKASRLWNILWILLPIFGWFALFGYGKKIVRSIVAGNTRELPAFGRFWKNFREGVFIIVFMIPTIAALMILNMVPLIGNLAACLFGIFLMPWLTMNFLVKETFESLWEIEKAYKKVVANIVEYIFTLLKALVFSIVYFVLCFVIVGIPCLTFGKNFFLAEFYRKHR